MRRLDSLELERAIAELYDLVSEGKLTTSEAQPVIRAFHQRGESEEAAILFEESCLTRSKTIVVEADLEAGELPFDQDEESWLFDEE